jgi:cell division septum initiation protein DivIVA
MNDLERENEKLKDYILKLRRKVAQKDILIFHLNSSCLKLETRLKQQTQNKEKFKTLPQETVHKALFG